MRRIWAAWVVTLMMGAWATAEEPMVLVVRSLSWTKPAASAGPTTRPSGIVLRADSPKTMVLPGGGADAGPAETTQQVGVALEADSPEARALLGGQMGLAPADAKENAVYRITVMAGVPFDMQVKEPEYELHLKGKVQGTGNVRRGEISLERRSGEAALESMTTNLLLPEGQEVVIGGGELALKDQPVHARRWQARLEKGTSASAPYVLSLCERIEKVLEQRDQDGLRRVLVEAPPLVREYVAVRCRRLGIDDRLAAELSAGLDETLLSDDLAATLVQALAGVQRVAAIGRGEIVFILTSVLEHGLTDKATRHGLPEQAFHLTLELISIVDDGKQLAPEQLAAPRSLMMPNAKKTMEREAGSGEDNEGARRQLVWLRENSRYLYFHPISCRFDIDMAARQEGIASGVFRRVHHWGPDDGPNRTTGVRAPVP